MTKETDVVGDVREEVGPGTVRAERVSVELPSGLHLSALRWGQNEPAAVMLHGRGQNAYTWGGVVRELGWPVVAFDLPGHGHSDWRDDHDYGAWPNAEAVAAGIAQLAPLASVVVGMSLGGGTTMRLGARHPALVRRAVIIDTTPANREGRAPLTPEQQGAVGLLDGPGLFSSFEEMLDVTAAAIPNRSRESLERGVRRNARQLSDGQWTWRYDRERPAGGMTPHDRTLLWNDLAEIQVPVMLVRGGRSGRVVESDVEEFTRRQPRARVEIVAGAGHSVQSDAPAQLARLIEDFVGATPD